MAVQIESSRCDFAFSRTDFRHFLHIARKTLLPKFSDSIGNIRRSFDSGSDMEESFNQSIEACSQIPEFSNLLKKAFARYNSLQRVCSHLKMLTEDERKAVYSRQLGIPINALQSQEIRVDVYSCFVALTTNVKQINTFSQHCDQRENVHIDLQDYGDTGGFFQKSLFLENTQGDRCPVIVTTNDANTFRHELEHLLRAMLFEFQPLRLDVHETPYDWKSRLKADFEIYLNHDLFEIALEKMRTQLRYIIEMTIEIYLEETRAQSRETDFQRRNILDDRYLFSRGDGIYADSLRQTLRIYQEAVSNCSKLTPMQVFRAFQTLQDEIMTYKAKVELVGNWLIKLWDKHKNAQKFADALFVIPENKPWYIAEHIGESHKEARRIYQNVHGNPEESKKLAKEILFEMIETAEYWMKKSAREGELKLVFQHEQLKPFSDTLAAFVLGQTYDEMQFEQAICTYRNLSSEVYKKLSEDVKPDVMHILEYIQETNRCASIFVCIEEGWKHSVFRYMRTIAETNQISSRAFLTRAMILKIKSTIAKLE